MAVLRNKKGFTRKRDWVQYYYVKLSVMCGGEFNTFERKSTKMFTKL